MAKKKCKSERHLMALIHPIALRVCKGYILISRHSSDDNGPGEVWNCLDPLTGKPALERFHQDEIAGADARLYRPGSMPTKADLEKAEKAWNQLPNF